MELEFLKTCIKITDTGIQMDLLSYSIGGLIGYLITVFQDYMTRDIYTEEEQKEIFLDWFNDFYASRYGDMPSHCQKDIQIYLNARKKRLGPLFDVGTREFINEENK